METSEWIKLKHYICDLEAGLAEAVETLKRIGPTSAIAERVKELTTRLEKLYEYSN